MIIDCLATHGAYDVLPLPLAIGIVAFIILGEWECVSVTCLGESPRVSMHRSSLVYCTSPCLGKLIGSAVNSSCSLVAMLSIPPSKHEYHDGPYMHQDSGSSYSLRIDKSPVFLGGCALDKQQSPHAISRANHNQRCCS